MGGPLLLLGAALGTGATSLCHLLRIQESLLPLVEVRFRTGQYLELQVRLPPEWNRERQAVHLYIRNITLLLLEEGLQA